MFMNLLKLLTTMLWRKKMHKVVYHIQGLDCPNCARGLNDYINTIDGIKTSEINFINETLTIVYNQKPFDLKKLNELVLKGSDDPVVITLKENNNINAGFKIFDKDVIGLLIRVFVATILLILARFVFTAFVQNQYDVFWGLMLGTYIIAYLIVAYDYIWKFLKAFRHPKTMINEVVLMVVASIGAFAIQEFPEAVLVMILAQVGEIFEHVSLNKSKNIIVTTIDSRPKMANVYQNGQLINVEAKSLNIGDTIVLKSGDVVPVDGIVTTGEGLLDTSSVTGEFEPVSIKSNSVVYSGTTLIDGTVDLKVSHRFEDSTTSKILEMVMESGQHKSKAENFISKFAKIYTPIVFVLALVIGGVVPLIISLINGNFDSEIWHKFIYIALTFLVISCPCAIVISVPLAYFVGTALASKGGVIIKGTNYLDRLNDLSLVVSDKTGTLTTGKFNIEIRDLNNIDEKTFKQLIFMLESHSNHPIAKEIASQFNVDIKLKNLKNFHDLPGFGVIGEYNKKVLLFGNINLMEKENIKVPVFKNDDHCLYLAINNTYVGTICVDDTIKESAKPFISFLNNKNIQTLMLTGGNQKSAQTVANKLGISRFESNLLPEDKIKYLKQELDSKNPSSAIAYLGDGINDAPSIILADIGIAMGGLGSDASKQNADIVLINDDLFKIAETIDIAKATRRRAIFNIVVALLIKLSVMILAMFSLINMWVAVLTDTGLAVVLIISSILLIKHRVKLKQ